MFSTGLPPGETAMTRAAGLQPLGQVTGTCVYRATHIRGRGPTTRYAPGTIYRYYEPVEAVIQSRRTALRRLSRQAGKLGADLVTDVRVEQAEREIPGARETDGGFVEATATGYALARSGEPGARRKPVLTTMSVGEYWKLAQSGYAPAGVVMATVMVGSVASGAAPDGAGPSAVGAWDPAGDRLTAGDIGSRELTDVSAMVRAAWRSAERAIRQQAQAHGAEGIVDVSFTSRTWLADAARLAFKMMLTVTGTSIAPARSDGAGPGAEGGRLVIMPVRHV